MKDSNNIKSLIIKSAVIIIMLLAASIKIFVYIFSKLSLKRKSDLALTQRIQEEHSSGLPREIATRGN